jgi:uncharacterized repeat protein (TIGR03943 family)
VSLAFLVSLVMSDRPVFPETGHLVRGMILLLPILFMGAAEDQTLGSFALSKRKIAPIQDTGPGGSISTDAILPGRIPEEASAGPARAVDSARHPAPEISMVELVRNWPLYNGRHICVEGLFSDTVGEHDHLSAVFRYFVVCCMADALPVGVFMERPEHPDLKDNDWVRITGQVVMNRLDGFDILFMETAVVEKTDPPAKTSAYIFD